MEYGTCETEITHKRIVLKENKSQIIFKNETQSTIRKIRIDGCVINDGLRCDYLIIDNFGTQHFIELKGCDIKHAIDQIESTICKIVANPKLDRKEAFIISSRCPLIDTEIQSYKVRFKKYYNTKLEIKNIYCEHEI